MGMAFSAASIPTFKIASAATSPEDLSPASGTSATDPRHGEAKGDSIDVPGGVASSTHSSPMSERPRERLLGEIFRGRSSRTTELEHAHEPRVMRPVDCDEVLVYSGEGDGVVFEFISGERSVIHNG